MCICGSSQPSLCSGLLYFTRCDCDQFTRNYYRVKFGVSDFTPVRLPQYPAQPINMVRTSNVRGLSYLIQCMYFRADIKGLPVYGARKHTALTCSRLSATISSFKHSILSQYHIRALEHSNYDSVSYLHEVKDHFLQITTKPLHFPVFGNC